MVVQAGHAPRPAAAPSSDKAVASTTASSNGVPKASDKRRAQNRAAQKTYREKRKRRLQELEQLAAAAGLVDADQSPVTTTTPTTQAQEQQNGERGSTNSSTSSAQGSPDGGFALPLRQSPAMQPASLATGAEADSRIFELDGLLDDNSWLDNNMTFPDMSGTSTDLLWPAVDDFTSTSPFATTSQYTNDMSLVRTNSSCGYSRNSPGSSSESSFDHASLASGGWKPEVRQHITFHQTLRWAAFFEIAAYLNIPMDQCEVIQDSSFYRPINPAAADSDSLVLAVRDSYANLHRDLRPTKLQITRRHASYIDILPWPDMRDKLIELTTADPPLFDDDELWADIENDGLVCWGNMAGGTKQNPLSGGGAPCDARSWEAKTWFLAKWSWIIGGDDSELARNSAWWRAMRGVGQGYSFG